MILTYKIKHNQDYTELLKKAKDIAEFVLAHKEDTLSSKHVSQFGLPSYISNQIIRKYQRNKTIKTVKSVQLTVPSDAIKVNREENCLIIACLRLKIRYYFPNNFIKINQIEIGSIYCHIAVSYKEPPLINTSTYLGVDMNTTGHCVVMANPQTGKVFKFGKKANHIHQKYKHIRRYHQRLGAYRTVKKIKDRENRIIKNLNHQISRKIINEAIKQNCHVKVEKLTGIRKRAKSSKKFRYSLNSWSFYQLGEMLRYKAKKSGISIVEINPAYTSQTCSRCGLIGNRNGKIFKCPSCGHADHADANASFNIGIWQITAGQLYTDSDVYKGNTDIPRMLLA